MVARLLPFLLCATTAICKAQDNTTGAGLLRGSATIAPGIMVHDGSNNIHLAGKLEYFIDPRISFRGEGFWFRANGSEPLLLAQNSKLGFGPFYHFGMGSSDLAVGFEPGLSFVQPARAIPLDASQGLAEEPLRIVPNISLCASYTFSVWKYFHFFLDARYVHAAYPGAIGGTIRLDEVIIGGGLGFQLQLPRRTQR